MGYINSKYPMANYLVNKYKDGTEKYWTKYNIDELTDEASERIVKFIFGE